MFVFLLFVSKHSCFWIKLYLPWFKFLLEELSVNFVQCRRDKINSSKSLAKPEKMLRIFMESNLAQIEEFNLLFMYASLTSKNCIVTLFFNLDIWTLFSSFLLLRINLVIWNFFFVRKCSSKARILKMLPISVLWYYGGDNVMKQFNILV